MTTAERNKHLRELADEIAASVATVIGLRCKPRCLRITRRRGWGYYDGRFSVPAWAANGPTEYFAYYVAHEVCHAEHGPAHGPVFRAREVKALASLGLAPIYEKAGAGPYLDGLADANTNKMIVEESCKGSPRYV